MASKGDLVTDAGAGSARVERALPGEVRVRRALLSVSDKTGIVELARGLAGLGVQIVSTGGTARTLSDAGVQVRAIEDFTGFPEIMDGRVKTLHPRLYAGLLALRDDDAHLDAAADQQIEPVDLVCVNLYPFEQTVANPDAEPHEVIENIDIGGPTMIRAAAKNSDFAAVLVDPGDYEQVLAELRDSDGRLTLATRASLAAKAFALTARYDAAIATWLSVRTHEGFPPSWRDAYEKVTDLRYGENPHQQAAFYARVGAPTHLLAGVRQLHGKELSFNNLLDLSAARELVEEFDEPACAIIKHNNPCGCAVAGTAQQAYERAFACDPDSAYGGVLAVNRPVDAAFAERLSEQFIEVLLAPAYDAAALAALTVKKNIRLLELDDWPAPAEPGDTRSAEAGRHSPPARIPGSASIPEPASEVEAKPVIGGQLVQTRDRVDETRKQMRVMGAREPSDAEWRSLLFAWVVCRHVRSNAIVIAAVDERSGALATIGIGAGQMSRVDAVRIAVEKARAFQPELLSGSALASDAFFPFPDAPQLGIDAGVRSIIQPGGSVRDELSVEAADAAGVAMVATGIRHFRH